MKCTIKAELTNKRFAELGDPCRIFREPLRGLVAIASRLPHLGYPGHWLHPDPVPPVHRLSVYDQSNGRLLGITTTRFPVNDVAFDPQDESLLIATGSYDGGWSFWGYLLKFYWKTGYLEQLLGNCQEVVACRFNEKGEISALLRPSNEEEFIEDHSDAWSIGLGLNIDPGPGPWAGQPAELPREDPRLEGLRPSKPSDHGFNDDVVTYDRQRLRVWREEAHEWLRSMQADLYHGIWDIHWIHDDSFAIATNGRSIEIRDIIGRMLHRKLHLGNSIQIINHPTLGLLSHVQENDDLRSADGAASELWQWHDDRIRLLHRFDRIYAFSFDSSGMGLGIDVDWRMSSERRDILIDGNGRIVGKPDCGRNNRVGPITFPPGLEALYYLKESGDSTGHNDDYRLWRHEGSNHMVNLRRWDPPERDFCPIISVAHSPGKILGAGLIYNRTTHQKLGNFLELVELQSGLRTVSIPLQGSPTSIALSDDKLTALVGFPDGSLGCFDLGSQTATYETKLALNGLASVPLSLALRGNRVLIGTQDGRILKASLT